MIVLTFHCITFHCITYSYTLLSSCPQNFLLHCPRYWVLLLFLLFWFIGQRRVLFLFNGFIQEHTEWSFQKLALKGTTG